MMNKKDILKPIEEEIFPGLSADPYMDEKQIVSEIYANCEKQIKEALRVDPYLDADVLYELFHSYSNAMYKLRTNHDKAVEEAKERIRKMNAEVYNVVLCDRTVSIVFNLKDGSSITRDHTFKFRETAEEFYEIYAKFSEFHYVETFL